MVYVITNSTLKFDISIRAQIHALLWAFFVCLVSIPLTYGVDSLLGSLNTVFIYVYQI